MTEALRGLKWLEPVVDIGRMGAFALFVALGLFAARTNREHARHRVDALLLYVTLVTGVVGLSQLESWPFTQWALVSHLSPTRVASLEIQGLDAAGRAYTVDLRVLQPLAPEEFASWLRYHLPRLGARQHANLGRFLLERAEAGRRRLRQGDRVAPNQWALGSLAAPYHFHDAKTWTSPSQVPTTPFTAVRAFFLEWDVEERYADPSRVSRRLLFEYRDDERSDFRS